MPVVVYDTNILYPSILRDVTVTDYEHLIEQLELSEALISIGGRDAPTARDRQHRPKKVFKHE